LISNDLAAHEGRAGSAVVLLAGIGCSVLEWRNNIAALATRHRVYAFDMLGHGLTDKPQKNCYAIADLARFTLAFLSAQGEASAHFIGNSLGGRIALECARLAPARVKSMVLAAPAGIGRETALTMRLASLPVLGNLLTRPSRMGMRMLWSPAFHDPSFVTRACPRARCASGDSQNTAKLSLGQRISDRKGRGPAGRHARNPPANPDCLGTAGQACAAGSRRHCRSEVAAIENDPVRRMRPSSAA
jgi:pimeloyl-ACP methyl ester carboxylesterase